MSVQDEPYYEAPAIATAAWKGQLDKLKKLVKDGADVNARDSAGGKGGQGSAPLVLAVEKASSHGRHIVSVGGIQHHMLL